MSGKSEKVGGEEGAPKVGEGGEDSEGEVRDIAW